MSNLRLSDQSEYDAENCIICVKRSESKPGSGQQGREKVWLTAQDNQDDVHSRLLLLGDRENFKYHFNCYRSYTKSLYKKCGYACEQFEEEPEIVSTSSDKNCDEKINEFSHNTSRVTRSRNALYNSNNKSCKSIETVCVVCDQVKDGSDTQKSCIQDPKKAELFFEITRNLQDDVYHRTAHLHDAESILLAGIFYHANCLRAYEMKFERTMSRNIKEQQALHTNDRFDEIVCENELNDQSNTSHSQIFDKSKSVLEYIQSIEHRIISGEAMELSYLTKEIKNKYAVQENLDNRFVKNALIGYFGESIGFAYPKQKNKSIMIFYTKLSMSAMVNTLRSSYQMKDCANDLRKVMKEVDFGLKNKYCDEHDLRTSWNNFKFPKEFVEFFSELFNIEEKRFDLEKRKEKNREDEKDHVDKKILKIQCLFQTMYYIMNDGKSRTPLHIATGMSVHHVLKSKNTVTNLNRLGVSISYPEVERFHVGLANYTARSAEVFTPLPSKFQRKLFTTASLDNFDHETYSLSGLKGTHDTVTVLFQQESLTNISRKPDILDNSEHSVRSLSKPLKCQLKRNFSKLRKGIYLPENYTAYTSEVIITPEAFERSLDPNDLAWYLCRMKIDDTTDHSLLLKNEQQSVPSWAAFHSLFVEDYRPCSETGFLPVLPHPVTEVDTVYTAMCNLLEILSQLDQKNLPITCDEGVFKFARQVKFERDEEFKDLLIMLGSFHTEKVIYSCIGKYLEESGIDNVLIEINLFGKNVAQQMLSGSHYSRAVKGYFILGEALTRLQLRAFFTKDRLEKYHNELEILESSTYALTEGSMDEAKKLLEIFSQCCGKLEEDFENFLKNRSNQSQLFRYFNNVLIMIDIAHDSHKSDRNGDWNLHVEALKKQQPLFFALDRIHYARYGPIHLEDCLNLERDMPDVYREFMKGAFTVKHTNKPFSSVATDQGLEQTINKAGKSSCGILGSTNNKNAFAVWAMTFHESSGINSFYREIMGLDDDNEELQVHHEFNSANTQSMEDAVHIVVQYLLKRVNPFQEGSQPLRNIVTGQLVDETVADKILDVFNIGCQKFNEFREQRIIKKTVPLSETIHHTKLPNFKTVYKEPVKKTASRKKDLLHQTIRVEGVAGERNFEMKELLCYDISPNNILFDQDGLMVKETKKYELTHILESNLDPETDYVISNSPMGIVVDVMFFCRKVSWKNLRSFADFVKAFCSLVKSNIFYNTVIRIDFVFDDYFELSPKSSERIRRCNDEFIELFEINEDVPLPTQEKKFWASEKNKEMLQVFLRQYILLHSTELWPQVELVFSTIENMECISTLSHLKEDPSMSSLQRHDIEEADTKLILHINDSCIQGIKNILLLSSDTDVVALVINFWSTFTSNGLQELWMRIGVAATVRNLPVHKLATKLSFERCQSMVAAHHLTGADYTSKLGTKLMSQRAEPEKHLVYSGRGSSETFTNCCIEMAEKYLLDVVANGSGCKNFNELRHVSYYHSALVNCDISKLPPTSATLALHIRRAFYVTYQQVNCLDENIEKLDPLLYGYEIQNDLLVPAKVKILLPPFDKFVPSCDCKACMFEKSCICVRAGIKCCRFCSCQKKQTCRNKFNDNN